jgi:riboflavin kinase / FMN adenylyltransferase
MRLIRNINTYVSKKPSVATIGTFDGVHLGHNFMLQKLVEKSNSLGMDSVVICFEPQPKEFFMGDKAPPRLTQLRDKLIAFDRIGIDNVILIQFNKGFHSLTAEDFIKNILIKSLKLNYLVIGDDFRFGSDRKGDFELLKVYGKDYSFIVDKMDSYMVAGSRVSSTSIRNLIKDHKVDEVRSYLGGFYAITGRVHHGEKIGRKLGFPTINLPVISNLAVSGVYVVQVEVGDKLIYGIANIGSRPTVCGKKSLLEVHLYDYKGDLYGQYVRVNFLKYIRSEKKFDSFDCLAGQIKKDKELGYSWVKKIK